MDNIIILCIYIHAAYVYITISLYHDFSIHLVAVETNACSFFFARIPPNKNSEERNTMALSEILWGIHYCGCSEIQLCPKVDSEMFFTVFIRLSM